MVRQDGTHVIEAKVPTCPDAIAGWLAERTEGLERVGMETGPLAVWLWNAVTERQVPIICMDARHASGVLKMMANKTDRHDARGLAQIVRTGWFKAAQIKSHDAYVNRAMLTAREALVGMRVRLENEIRGLLKTFGIMFGKRVGGFKRRAEEIIEGELAVAPELVPIFEALMQARRDILARIAALDSRIRAVAKRHATVRLLMTALGRGTDHGDGGCRRPSMMPPVFRRSSSAGRLSRADAEALRVRRDQPERAGVQNGEMPSPESACSRPRTPSSAETFGGPGLRGWARAIAERTGPRKAKVALARKLAVTLHAMWRTNTPFREAAMA